MAPESYVKEVNRDEVKKDIDFDSAYESWGDAELKSLDNAVANRPKNQLHKTYLDLNKY